MRLRHRLSSRPPRNEPRGKSSKESSRSSPGTARSSRSGGRLAAQRPSLLLWRHRHLVVAVCLGTAVLVALSVLRPGPEQGQQALIAARQISAGALITEKDVSTVELPASALPQSGLASREQVVGTRAAIALEAGTVLTISMTSGNMAQQLGPDERVVQVPIDVGAELARPGARVDIIGQVQEGWIPQATSQDDTQPSSTVPPEGSNAQAGTPAQNDPENSSTNAPTQAPDTPSLSPSDQEPPGIQKPPQSLSQGKSTGPFAQHSMVLCSGARVIMTQEAGESGRWTENKKVTLITLAIPAGSAILVVSAATNSTLGIALSP